MCNTELSFDSCRSLAYAAITIGLSIKSQPPFSGFHGVKRPCPDIDILPESGINGNLNFIYQKKMRFSGKDTLPMRAVDIGITWFPNPSPKLNANTAVCLVMPTISATGVKASYIRPQSNWQSMNFHFPLWIDWDKRGNIMQIPFAEAIST